MPSTKHACSVGARHRAGPGAAHRREREPSVAWDMRVSLDLAFEVSVRQTIVALGG